MMLNMRKVKEAREQGNVHLLVTYLVLFVIYSVVKYGSVMYEVSGCSLGLYATFLCSGIFQHHRK